MQIQDLQESSWNKFFFDQMNNDFSNKSVYYFKFMAK